MRKRNVKAELGKLLIDFWLECHQTKPVADSLDSNPATGNDSKNEGKPKIFTPDSHVSTPQRKIQPPSKLAKLAKNPAPILDEFFAVSDCGQLDLFNCGGGDAS